LKNFYEAELREILSRAREEEAEAAATPDAGTTGPEELAEPFAEPPPPFARPREPFAAPPDDGASNPALQQEPSWFDAIFDTNAPPSKTGDERLSSQVSSRLRSQVSARLRRLRQPAPGNAITEGEGGDS
jgi:hypothetical protein